MDQVPLSFLVLFIFHKPSLFLSRPPYSMELCTEPSVILLYIEGKGGERLRKKRVPFGVLSRVAYYQAAVNEIQIKQHCFCLSSSDSR